MSVEDLWDNHPCVLQWVASSIHGRATLQANISLSSFINVTLTFWVSLILIAIVLCHRIYHYTPFSLTFH